uniref:Uncharacterized protein n=1 Tax=Rhizophora mucronata TaxID=61149 RepID=A0A2P2NNY9_RHIMU
MYRTGCANLCFIIIWLRHPNIEMHSFLSVSSCIF